MVRHMNEITFKISSIKNLNMVNFYHLFDEESGLPAIVVYYDNSEVINLCAADEGYTALLEKVVEVYSREAKYNRIIADDHTKALLNGSIHCAKEDYERLILNFSETKESVVSEKVFAWKMMLPIVKYCIEGLYQIGDATVSWHLFNKDWYGKGTLTASVNKKTTQFRYNIQKINDRMYRVLVSGVLKQYNVLTIDIIHDSKGLTIAYKDSHFSYEGNISVDFSGETPKMTYTIKRAGQNLYRGENSCEPLDGPPKTLGSNITLSDVTWKGFILPWQEQIFTAFSEGKEYTLFLAGKENDSFSIGICDGKIKEEGDEFGEICMFIYLLYESPAVTELHFLDAGSPGFAYYKENYATKKYILKKDTGRVKNGN